MPKLYDNKDKQYVKKQGYQMTGSAYKDIYLQDGEGLFDNVKALLFGRKELPPNVRNILKKNGNDDVDYIQVARNTLKKIGYNNTDFGIDYKGAGILVAYDKQSPDIAQGVNTKKNDQISQGAGDQGLMFGFACDETKNLMPVAIDTAHKIVQRQSELRKSRSIEWLRPDAKSQVTIEYENDRPHRIDTVVLSTQHSPEISFEALKEAAIEEIIKVIEECISPVSQLDPNSTAAEASGI